MNVIGDGTGRRRTAWCLLGTSGAAFATAVAVGRHPAMTVVAVGGLVAAVAFDVVEARRRNSDDTWELDWRLAQLEDRVARNDERGERNEQRIDRILGLMESTAPA